jgi:co-chaperonin GroES (HSP10)
MVGLVVGEMSKEKSWGASSVGAGVGKTMKVGRAKPVVDEGERLIYQSWWRWC